MSIIIATIHIIACIGLILVVLMQAGKGAGMGAAFGGSSQTVFGSSGATTLLTKATRIVALVFILTSLGITIFSGPKGSSSVMSGSVPVSQEAPASAPSQSEGNK